MTRQVLGRTIFSELEEIVDPRHTAALVVDTQNDNLDPEGWVARHGVDVGPLRAPVPSIASFLHEARRRGVLVVYLQYTHHEDGRSLSDPELSRWIRQVGVSAAVSDPPIWGIPGTWGHQIVPELTPLDGDLIVEKSRRSGFADTSLDRLLRSRGIRTVMMTGATTSGCVMYTARDAAMHDYYVVVLTDCLGSQREDWHDATVMIMDRLFDYVGPVEGVVRAWGQCSSARE